MGLIKPDFSEATEFKPIAPGVYAARIKEGAVMTSKKGDPMVKWTFELFGSPAVNNRQVNTYTMASGPGAGRLKQLYKAAIGEELNSGAEFDTDSLIGCEVTVTLTEGKDRDGNPSQYPDVKSVTKYQA